MLFINVGYIWISWDSPRLYEEIFRRYGQDFAAEVVYDLTPEKSKIGEAALL